MQKGYKHTKESRAKMSAAAFSRDNALRLAAMPKGENHWKWCNKPNLLTLHKRIHRKHGAAKKHICSKCKKNQANDWANVTGNYTDRVEDYRPFCRSCHVKMDRNWIKKPSL